MIAFVPFLGVGYLSSGLKGGIFAIWLFLNFFLFLYLIAWSVDKETKVEPKGFISSYVDIWFNMNGYTAFLIIFAAIIIYASFGLWDFLDSHIALNETPIPTSTMPSPARNQ